LRLSGINVVRGSKVQSLVGLVLFVSLVELVGLKRTNWTNETNIIYFKKVNIKVELARFRVQSTLEMNIQSSIMRPSSF
jgi:hypothetical protein